MLAVEKWAQDKPAFIALVAPQIAVFARDIPDIVNHQKKHRLFQHALSKAPLTTCTRNCRRQKQKNEPSSDSMTGSCSLKTWKSITVLLQN